MMSEKQFLCQLFHNERILKKRWKNHQNKLLTILLEHKSEAVLDWKLNNE